MLPKITHPVIELVIPSTKKKVKVRPMLVKEEKILLIAKQSEDDNDILLAIKQIVNNCILEDIDVDKIALFDLEYLFLKIRAASVNNIVNLAFRDLEDEQEYKFDVDLLEIEVKFPENVKNKVEIDEKTGILLKYPPAKLYSDKEFLSTESSDEMTTRLLISCIDKIYDETSVFKSEDYKYEQLKEFLEDLPIPVYEKLNEFVSSTPKIEKILDYTDKNGKEKKIYLTTLNDFFMLR